MKTPMTVAVAVASAVTFCTAGVALAASVTFSHPPRHVYLAPAAR